MHIYPTNKVDLPFAAIRQHGPLEFQIRIQIKFYMSGQFYNLKQRSHGKTLNKFSKYA